MHSQQDCNISINKIELPYCSCLTLIFRQSHIEAMQLRSFDTTCLLINSWLTRTSIYIHFYFKSYRNIYFLQSCICLLILVLLMEEGGEGTLCALKHHMYLLTKVRIKKLNIDIAAQITVTHLILAKKTKFFFFFFTKFQILEILKT